MTVNMIKFNIKLWYSSLGYPSSQILKNLNLMECSNDSELLYNYFVCPLAKHARLFFLSSTSKAFALFDVIHMDLWGPYKTPTNDKKHYFLTVVDDESKFVWVN